MVRRARLVRQLTYAHAPVRAGAPHPCRRRVALQYALSRPPNDFAVRDHKTNKAKDDAPAEERYIDWRAEC